jgi:vacuolar-type H+-ATPase subunit F/Vma7
MAGVAVIGAWGRVRGWVLSGATVRGADSADEVRVAWRELDPDVTVVVLTEQAAEILSEERGKPGSPLVAVIP